MDVEKLGKREPGIFFPFSYFTSLLPNVDLDIDLSYHLKHSDVFLPPEILSHPFSKGREHVVGVHDGVHKAVQHRREEGCKNCKYCGSCSGTWCG